MAAYYIDYPRDFGNEYTVYAVAHEDVDDFKRALPDATRITYTEAVRLGWTRPKEAKRDGEQWFGGFAEAHGADDLKSKLADAAIATSAFVETYRIQRDFVCG